jgi:glyoxylase-like metal-dependent hydrolase (beta-lactamase superfamily II)
VITHFHGDHVQGASEYRKVWPDVQIISSEPTREAIQDRLMPRRKRELLGLPARLDKLKADLGKETDNAKKSELQKNLQQGEAYLAELTAMPDPPLPNITVDNEMVLHGKSRDVRILWLGKAHTDGDLFVYVPDAKVLVTGDVVHGATPSLGDAYPYDWIHTLDAAERLDFDYAIGGHGDVLHGKAAFGLWIDYFNDLLKGAGSNCTSGATMDDVRQSLSRTLLASYQGKFPTGGAGAFPKTVFDNIEKAYQVVCGPFVNNPIAH